MPQKLNRNQLSAGNLNWVDPGSTNFVHSTATFTDVTGVTTTYTTGNTAEHLNVWLSFMALGGTTNNDMEFRMVINGSNVEGRYFTISNAGWRAAEQLFQADIPANTTATIKMQARALTSSVTIARDNSTPGYLAKIQGFGVAQ